MAELAAHVDDVQAGPLAISSTAYVWCRSLKRIDGSRSRLRSDWRGDDEAAAYIADCIGRPRPGDRSASTGTHNSSKRACGFRWQILSASG